MTNSDGNIAKRVKNMEESGIRKVFALASGNRGEYINLSIGQPDFEAPQGIKAAIGAAAEEGNNGYTQTQGLKRLRQKIAHKLKQENDIQAREDDIIVTAGASGALFLALGSLLDPGDEVIIPDPYFVMYKQLAVFLGAKPVYLDTYPGFGVDAGKLESLVTPKTKCLVLNSPNNPTGRVYSREEIKGIVQVAEKLGIFIISDEVYEKFDYDNKFFSPGSIYKKTITVNGFSKSHAITGWRAGYAHAPSGLIEAMGKLQQYTFVCAASPVQAALAREMDNYPDGVYKEYKKKRDMIWSGLKDKFDLARPEGAFYVFLKQPEGVRDFWQKLLDKKLLTVPGRAFSGKDEYIRLSYAVPDKDIERALDILNNIQSLNCGRNAL